MSTHSDDPTSVSGPQVGPRHEGVRRLIAARKGNADGVLVEGKWAHRLLLERGASIDTLLWCPEVGADSPEAVELAPRVAEVARASYRVSTATLRRVSARNAPDGLVSLVSLPEWDPSAVATPERSLVLVVDGVNYAGNLGNLIRTADGAGAVALVVTNSGVRRTHPLVFLASRGALLTLPMLEFDTVEAAADWLSGRGFVCYLADPDAERDYTEADYTAESVAMVVGSEGKGLSRSWSEAPHRAVSIPQYGLVDSLNVGTAAAVLLFEVARQHASGAAGRRPDPGT